MGLIEGFVVAGTYDIICIRLMLVKRNMSLSTETLIKSIATALETDEKPIPLIWELLVTCTIKM